jgi:hypothetical protein
MKILLLILFWSTQPLRADILPLNWSEMTEEEKEDYRKEKSEWMERRAEKEFSKSEPSHLPAIPSEQADPTPAAESDPDLKTSFMLAGIGGAILLLLRFFKK